MKSNMLKKWILMAMLLVSITASAYDFEADGIYYNITSMSELEVEVTNNSLGGSSRFYSESDHTYCVPGLNSSYSGEIVIPASVNYNNRTFSVVAIGRCAFGGSIFKESNYSECPNTTIPNGVGCDVTSVSLPNTIRTIKDNAFRGCVNLSTIKINSGVLEISDYAFLNTPNLQSIALPNTLTKLGAYSLSRTGLKELIIPNSVKEISDYAFYRNSNLASIIIGSSVCSIGTDALDFNPKLLEVFYLPKEKPNGFPYGFSGSHANLEVYVPSVEAYGFGREYLTFQASSFDYTGSPHNIKWANNLKAYKCEIAESDSQTDVNAGQYTKYVTATYSNGINFSVEVPYEYTINKAQMTLTVNDAQREYGEPNPAFTCSISGFVNGENEAMLGSTPTFECEASQISKVGNYRILASLEAPNYEITYNYGTLSVVKAPLTVSVIDAARIYGNDNPDFSLSFSGLKNGETVPEWSVKPRISTTATIDSKVGEYSIIASDGVAENYDVVKYNPGTLTVNKRDLIVKANDCERLYQEENPSFEISYIGFVNNDSEDSLIEKPIAECNASVLSDAGTYPIEVSGGEAENYSFTYQDGTLKVNPLKVGFKNVYNSVTYNNMDLSSSENHFNYIPEIIGPFSEDDFWVELWFLDKDNKYDQHVSTITEGDYAGNYVNTNTDRPMWAGKYIYNLKSKGTNPNVIGDPSRAYLTVDRTSNNLEWNTNSPIILHVGDKIDLSISYQADLWCTFNTDYDEELIELSSEGKNGNNPHWFAKGLKEGETTLFFGIECKKNDLGFYDFSDSEILSKRIIVKPSAGIDSIGNDSTITVTVNDGSLCVSNKTHNSLVRVYTLQGTKIIETEDNKIENLLNGIYIVTVENRSFKVKI